jgi:hypothetical protein
MGRRTPPRPAPGWGNCWAAAGRGLIDRADAWLRAEGVVAPARMAALWAPGFPESSLALPD